MSSINGNWTANINKVFQSQTTQGIGMPADRVSMDPIKGTDVSLAVAQIAINSVEDANNLEMAKARLVFDTVRESGAQLVKLLENLGQNVDLYA